MESEGMAAKPRELRQRYFLTPAECNPQGRMPLTLLINRLIEIATLHANEIGIGYASLVGYRQTWVLSRVAVEMTRYPEVNDHYEIATWICSVNRLFSERDFCIYDSEGGVSAGRGQCGPCLIRRRGRVPTYRAWHGSGKLPMPGAVR